MTENKILENTMQAYTYLFQACNSLIAQNEDLIANHGCKNTIAFNQRIIEMLDISAVPLRSIVAGLTGNPYLPW